jgi:nitrite reductase/ring-hydroxylating ferredoxin subunit
VATGERLICASGDLADGGRGVRFEVEYHGRLAPAFAVRYRGQVYAYLNRCAHVPTELDWNAGEFFDASGLYLICATHGALYSPITGGCLGGRCNSRGLRALEVREHGGCVYLMQEGD